MKMIQVLGTGCTKCVTLENNIKVALEKSGIQAQVEKVTDIAEIASYGIMGTPWLVVDGKVLSVGKVLEVDEIISLLEWWEVVSDNNKKEEKTSCCSSDTKNEASSCCSGKEEKTSCCSWSKKKDISWESKKGSFFSRILGTILPSQNKK